MSIRAAGSHRPVETRGAGADGLMAFARESAVASVFVVIPRFAFERRGGQVGAAPVLPPELAVKTWRGVLSLAGLLLPWAVLVPAA